MGKKKSSGAMSGMEPSELLNLLQQRFEQNPQRHPKLAWSKVQAKLQANPAKLSAIYEMERTGGEPDVWATTNPPTNTCSATVRPKARRSSQSLLRP